MVLHDKNTLQSLQHNSIVNSYENISVKAREYTLNYYMHNAQYTHSNKPELIRFGRELCAYKNSQKPSKWHFYVNKGFASHSFSKMVKR